MEREITNSINDLRPLLDNSTIQTSERLGAGVTEFLVKLDAVKQELKDDIAREGSQTRDRILREISANSEDNARLQELILDLKRDTREQIDGIIKTLASGRGVDSQLTNQIEQSRARISELEALNLEYRSRQSDLERALAEG